MFDCVHTVVSSHGCDARNWSQFVSLFTVANWLLAAPDELPNKRFRISFPVASRIALADIMCLSFSFVLCSYDMLILFLLCKIQSEVEEKKKTTTPNYYTWFFKQLKRTEADHWYYAIDWMHQTLEAMRAVVHAVPFCDRFRIWLLIFFCFFSSLILLLFSFLSFFLSIYLCFSFEIHSFLFCVCVSVCTYACMHAYMCWLNVSQTYHENFHLNFSNVAKNRPINYNRTHKWACMNLRKMCVSVCLCMHSKRAIGQWAVSK